MAKRGKNYLEKRSKELLDKEKNQSNGGGQLGKALTAVSLIVVIVFAILLYKEGYFAGIEEPTNTDKTEQITQQTTQPTQINQVANIDSVSFKVNKNELTAAELYSNPKSLDHWYSSNSEGVTWKTTSFASLNLKNTGEGTAKDITVRMEIGIFSDPVITKKETLAPGESWSLNVDPEPTQAVLSVKKDIPATLTITISYNNGKEAKKIIETKDITIRSRNYLSVRSPKDHWEDIMYVTPNDPALSKYLNTPIDVSSPNSIKNTLSRIWDSLSDDLKYETHADDLLFYPSETISKGGGQCADFSVLMTSIFEKLGLKSKIVFTSLEVGHSMPAYHDGNKWVYIEATMLGKADFEDAVDRGQENYERGVIRSEAEPRFFWDKGIRAPERVPVLRQ